jgi:amidase
VDDDFGAIDATAQRDLVRAGTVSAAELAEAAIARIARANPRLNAVSIPLYEYGRAAAVDPSLPTGELRGVPFLLKDAGACLAGLPLYLGCGLLRGLGSVAPADTTLGARIRAAGLVVVGKSNLPEFGCQPTTQPVAFGATRNPWDTARSVGGSSGGAAAAVAAGLVAIAHASDIGESIRIPAAWCGVIGLKPSRGRTSSAPIIDPNLVEHVITRSLRDTALALDVFAGPAAGDPYALDRPAEPYVSALERSPGQLRIGLAVSVDAAGLEVDPSCAEAARALAVALERVGHIVEFASPDALFDDAFAAQHLLSSAREVKRMLDGLAASVGRPLAPADVEAFSWALAAAGAATDDATYAASKTWERAYTASVLSWWSDYNLLVTPATGEPQPLLEELIPDVADPLAILPRFRRIWCFTAPFSVTGQPAITVPAPASAGSLPTGVQLDGPAGRSDVVQECRERE